MSVVSSDTTDTGPEDQSGFNPAWNPIKEKVGDAFFELIKPDLAEWDKGTQKKFQDHADKIKAYQELGTPEELGNFKQIVGRMDAEPVEFYEALGKFLNENGRMPTNAEAQDIADDIEDDQEDENEEDPRIAALQQDNEKIKQFLESQQSEAYEREANKQIDEVVKTLEQTHSKEDMKHIFQNAILLQERKPKASIEEVFTAAAAEFDALRERILTTPRPGSQVPKLLPTSGGASDGQPSPSIGKLTRDQTQDLVAARLAASQD